MHYKGLEGDKRKALIKIPMRIKYINNHFYDPISILMLHNRRCCYFIHLFAHFFIRSLDHLLFLHFRTLTCKMQEKYTSTDLIISQISLTKDMLSIIK